MTRDTDNHLLIHQRCALDDALKRLNLAEADKAFVAPATLRSRNYEYKQRTDNWSCIYSKYRSGTLLSMYWVIIIQQIIFGQLCTLWYRIETVSRTSEVLKCLSICEPHTMTTLPRLLPNICLLGRHQNKNFRNFSHQRFSQKWRRKSRHR
jgi:hypothetical protein